MEHCEIYTHYISEYTVHPPQNVGLSASLAMGIGQSDNDLQSMIRTSYFYI